MINHLPPGTFLNRNCYKITEFIAQGGFGITYKAEETGYFRRSGFDDDEFINHNTPVTVVIKELYYSDFCHRDETTGLVNISNNHKRFEFEKLVDKQLDEGKILRSLKHPHIIRTRDIFKENGTAYMVMDYVESTDINEMIKKNGKLNKEKALKYIRQILGATHYIHGKKILHLDITPSNILIRAGTDEAVLIDFGASLTYGVDNKASNNTTKMITGMKKHFAPVEQADIDNLKNFDASFDTYAIGASLYYMLTGKLPPVNSLIITGMEKVIPPSEHGFHGEISEYLDALVLRSMAPKFHDRFRTVEQLEQMLGREEEYIQKLEQINGLIREQQYSQALDEIKNATQNFVETAMLVKLRIFCQDELDKKRNEEQYQRFMSQGLNWYNRQEYALARNEFEKALILFPQNNEPREKISSCDLKIEEEEKKKKIDGLLSQAKQLIANGRNGEAREILRSIRDISPADAEAANLEEQIAASERALLENLQKKADELYEAEEYEQSLKIYNRIKEEGKWSEANEKRFQLLTGNEPDTIKKLTEKYKQLELELSRVYPERDNASQLLNSIRESFKQAEIHRGSLRLQSRHTAKLAELLSSRIGDIAKKIETIEEKTKLIHEEKKKIVPLEKPNSPAEIFEKKKDKENKTGEKLFEPVKKGNKKVRNFLIGAAIGVVVVFFVIKSFSGTKTSSLEDPIETATDTDADTDTLFAATDSTAVSTAYFLTTDDLTKIDGFVEAAKYNTGCDDDMRAMHDKILRSSYEQQDLRIVKKFEEHFKNVCY